MQPYDLLCRVAAYPKFIASGVFDSEQLFNFQRSGASDLFVSSIASRYLLRSEDGVHEYGLAYAKGVNARAEREQKSSTKCVYLGFYMFYFCEAIAIELDLYSVRVVWRPEKGLDPHFQIELWPLGGLVSKSALRNDRIVAVSILTDLLFGPVRLPGWKDSDEHQALMASLPVLRPLPGRLEQQ